MSHILYNLGKPTAQVFPKLLQVPIGLPAAFKCIVMHWQSWKHNNKDAQGFILLDGGRIILLPSVQKHHSGNYRCAGGGIGNRRLDFSGQLQVLGEKQFLVCVISSSISSISSIGSGGKTDLPMPVNE